jgi:immunity protein 35 of polymorphic toxin system
MLTFDETLAIAAAWVANRAQEAPGRELVILNGHIEERRRGWAFPCNTKRSAETQNPLDGLLGNGPVFVDRATGEVHALGSAKIRAWLEEYDRTGNAAGHPPWLEIGWHRTSPAWMMTGTSFLTNPKYRIRKNQPKA